MKGIKECITWMMKHNQKDLLSEDGKWYAGLDLDEFYVGEVVDLCIVNEINDFTIFEAQEWLIRSECIEMEKKLEEERKKISPEVLLSDWLSENADQYKDGSYVRGDNLWEDMFYYMCECGIELVKSDYLNEMREKIYKYDCSEY